MYLFSRCKSKVLYSHNHLYTRRYLYKRDRSCLDDSRNEFNYTDHRDFDNAVLNLVNHMIRLRQNSPGAKHMLYSLKKC